MDFEEDEMYSSHYNTKAKYNRHTLDPLTIYWIGDLLFYNAFGCNIVPVDLFSCFV